LIFWVIKLFTLLKASGNIRADLPEGGNSMVAGFIKT